MMVKFSAPSYWDRRYRDGRTSGAGSEGESAVRKAATINQLIKNEGVKSVVDWGVGDGTVLSMMSTEVDYYGIDISRFTIHRLRREWQHEPRRRFALLNEVGAVTADLGLSLDVIFHCVDDLDYELHLRRLFASAKRLVLIHSSDYNGGRTARHVRWRKFTGDVEHIAPGWLLESKPDNPRELGFYLYRRSGVG